MKSRLFVVMLVLGVLGILAFRRWHALPVAGASPKAARGSAVAANRPASTAADPSATRPPDDGPPPDSPLAREAAGTERMYEAHAPLRTPDFANADSAANRQVLQTMVLKALGHRDNKTTNAPTSQP
jgi:hypothetical protein